MGRRLSVNCKLAERDRGSIVEEVRRRVSAISLLAGYYVTSGCGQYECAQRAASALMLATGVALFIIFLLLFLALGSVAEAGLILATLPVALVGGVELATVTREIERQLRGGFHAHIGIAVQSGLVLVTQARQLETQGMGLRAAVREASINRLRPKRLTALCAMLGLLPLALTRGVGTEIERPMASVLIGGLFTSLLVTLLVLPVVYTVAFSRVLGCCDTKQQLGHPGEGQSVEAVDWPKARSLPFRQ